MIALFQRPRAVVVPVGPGDADDLAELHGAAFAQPWSADEFSALVSDTHVQAFGLRPQRMLRQTGLIGFILLRQVDDEAEILSIAVSAANRGRGFGRLLMDEALRHIYREGVDACFLEVDRDNTAAVALYSSLGFETVGERQGYYHPADGPAATALVMRLNLR